MLNMKPQLVKFNVLLLNFFNVFARLFTKKVEKKCILVKYAEKLQQAFQ